MRPVKGLERPAAQWALVAGCVLLVVLLAGAMVMIGRERAAVDRLTAAQASAWAELAALERELTRERTAREAFSLELARVRAREAPADAATEENPPTLTLVPPDKPSGEPPERTVEAPERAQTILLRLVLPAGVAVRGNAFLVAARDWSTGRAKWSTGVARTTTVEGRRALVTHVSGEMLGPGVYEITLSSATATPEPMAVYHIGVRE